MKKFILMTCTLFACSQSMEALLPPLAESIREIESILSNKQLTSNLTMADIIQDIKKTETGYLIVTQNQQLLVEVSYLPADRPGPAKFELHFNTPTRIGNN